MKTIVNSPRVLIATALILATIAMFAQSSDAKQDTQKYRLRVVKDENGNKEVIDKTFASKDELDNYVKENNIESPDDIITGPPLPPNPPNPPTPPTPAHPRRPPVARNAEPQDKTKDKKIIIIEKTGGQNGSGGSLIDLSNLPASDASKVIQEIINMNIAKIEVVHTSKDIKIISGPETNYNNEQIPHINEPPAGNATRNLGDLKVYPNPGSQFHVECSVNKPANVKLRLTDMQGHDVYEVAMNNVSGKFTKDIDAAGLSRGTYLMNIEDGGEKITTTVVLQ